MTNASLREHCIQVKRRGARTTTPDGRKVEVIRRVVGGPRIDPAPVEPRPPTPAPRHPLVEMGRGLSRFDYASTLLKQLGKLKTHHGQPWLNDAPARPMAIMVEANRVLKENGLPQIDGPGEWRV